MVSPGVAFLVRSLPLFAVPVFVGLGLAPFCHRLLGVSPPQWMLVFLSITCLPLYAAFKYHLRITQDERAAAARGARLIPLVQGKSIGSMDLLRKMQHSSKFGYPADNMSEAVAELGPIVNFRLLWADTILTTSPDHIKLILSTDFNNYVKGEQFKFNFHSVLGDGVFNSDGETWKYHRAMTKPFFSRDRISDFDIFDRHAEDVISLLKERTRAGYAVDFQDLIGRFTMDSASEFLFDSCLHSLKSDLPYAHNVSFPPPPPPSQSQLSTKFIEAFTAAMTHIVDRDNWDGIWPLFEILGDKTAGPMKDISEFLDPVIHAAMEKRKMGGKSEEEASSLLDDMLNTTSDPQLLKDEMLNMLLAGRDTTMHTITIVIYFFAMYPDVCVRARAEVLERVGLTRRPTYDDIKEMKYLRAVINETMRLYPSVPFNIRRNIKPAVWPSLDPSEKPLYIPADSKVAYSVFMMHRRKDLWGPDAEEFDPDRFLDDRVKNYLLKNPFQFLPFNAGPRICLGQQFAYNEMSFMITRLLQAFSTFILDEAAFSPEGRPPAEWAISGEGRKKIEKFRPKRHMTMSTADGMWIRVKEAGSV
ncbi:cytochrome P450 [Roridomyces roridus]|uniref:Cytochrome P450 n=1 Tax=Roridomyces roridus TaxID=1738132 RepID=A0AAD7BMT7_9AGAR|nr:cytochrome P450 [Roridomyces roridus]